MRKGEVIIHIGKEVKLSLLVTDDMKTYIENLASTNNVLKIID